MTDRQIYRLPPVIPASKLVEELGNALSRIRASKRLTFKQMDEMLGRGEGAASRYIDGTSEMPVSTYYRAKQLWNGEFTGAADAMLHDAAPPQDGYKAQTCILKSAAALSLALEDGDLTDAEIRANRSTLEQSRDAIDALLDRLAPRSVA